MKVLLAAAGVLLALASPALAENPVLDAEGDADVVAALAEATEVQDVCYGYQLSVSDGGSGQFTGQYSVSSLGVEVPATSSDQCSDGAVVLVAAITYTSQLSEAEDRAAWRLESSFPGVTIDDVEELGLSSGDLLKDDKSETTLLNAVLALPRLVSESSDVPPVLLDENTSALPPDARPTDTPGSDWLRENGYLLLFCVLLVIGGVALFLASFKGVRSALATADSLDY